ncbi:MAG: TIGR02757 family protein [Proteobacteria bacterium]|nr:TIGR02757 family protein [Pseudomonadota bacterium]
MGHSDILQNKKTKKKLDKLYNKYNSRKYVHPDPLEFLYPYNNLYDREIVGFIASSLAYGRVAQILKSVSFVLRIMEPSPYLFLKKTANKSINKAFSGFTHRFATGEKISAMLIGVKHVIKQHGSLYECFLKNFNKDDETILPALSMFASQLAVAGNQGAGHLIPLPDRGSACKRQNLFLRWMVRNDKVDPGGWDEVPSSKLIIPLDTHMHRMSLKLNFTKRKQADMRTALEVTEGFKRIVPDDPVKYDFALTRLGIRDDAESFLEIFSGGI